MSESPQQVDKMAKVRAAKKPAEYKNVHPDVKDLDDGHPASLKNVKEWESHNKILIKELLKDTGDLKERIKEIKSKQINLV